VQAPSSFSNLAFSSFETWKKDEYTFSGPLSERNYLDPTKVSRPQKHPSLFGIIAFVANFEEDRFKIEISSSYVLCASAERKPENKVANMISTAFTIQIGACMRVGTER